MSSTRAAAPAAATASRPGRAPATPRCSSSRRRAARPSLQPAGELGADAAAGRVDDDQRRARSGCRAAYAVASPASNRASTPGLAGRPARAVDRVGADLDAQHLAAGSGEVQREAADPAVEVPHRGAASTSDRPTSRACGRARRRPRCWSGRSSAAAGAGRRPCRGASAASRRRRCSTISRSPSSTALCSGWRFEGTTRSAGSAASSARQVLADRAASAVERSTKPQHQLAVRRLGDQHVLELAAAGADVVRRQLGAA